MRGEGRREGVKGGRGRGRVGGVREKSEVLITITLPALPHFLQSSSPPVILTVEYTSSPEISGSHCMTSHDITPSNSTLKD